MSIRSPRRLTWIIAANAALFVLCAPPPALAIGIRPSYMNLSADETALVDASFSFWEATILDSFEVSIEIERVALDGDTLARASGFVASADGRPAAARIEIDDRVGDFGAWFLDPTPFDASEFVLEGGRLVADPGGPASSLYDLLTVMHHELGHVLGFTVNYPAFAAHVVTDPGGARYYRGDSLDVPLSTHGTHVSPLFAFDLMSDLLALGERRSASELDVMLLADAFAYDVVLPPPPADVPEPAIGLLLAAAAVVEGARRFRRIRRR